jgi:hypothetical protein
VTGNDEAYGKAKLRILPAKAGGWSGIVFSGGKQIGDTLHDEDRERLRTRLMVLAGTEHPNYFGIEEAIARFLKFMPGGFAGERYNSPESERHYKVRARDALATTLPLEAARSASTTDANLLAAAFTPGKLWTNMLSLQESTRLRETLAGPNGSAFVQAAAKFTDGDLAAGLAGMRKAVAPHGASTWPIATYLPFFWSTERHMFLKPEATRDFAERVGHRFAVDYSSEHDPSVYESLIDLANHTASAIAKLGPVDQIDVQSFIWVVGRYKEADLPA